MTPRSTIFALLCLWPAVSSADDPKKDDQVILPWSDGVFSFTPKDKKLRLQYSYLGERRLLLQVRAAAPLDEESRLAPFLSENKLVQGFEAGFSLGYDTRSDDLWGLQSKLERLDQLVNLVSKPSAADLSIRTALWCQKNDVAPCSEEGRKERLIEMHGGTPPTAEDKDYSNNLNDQLDKVLLSLDPSLAQSDRGDRRKQAPVDFAKKVVEKYTEECEPKDLPDNRTKQRRALEPCSYDFAVVREVYQNRVNELELEAQVVDVLAQGLVDQLWAQLTLIDPKLAHSLEYDRKQDPIVALVQHREAILEALKTAVSRLRTATALEQRDQNLLAIRRAKDVIWFSASGEVNGSLDVQKAYQGTVDSAPVDVTNYDIQYGGNAALYLPALGVHLNLRAGAETAQKTTLKPFERCAALASNAADVTGKQCEAAANWVKSSIATKPETSGYVRFSAGAQWQNKDAKDAEFVPGFELRAGLEQLGATTTVPQFTMRAALFATPIKDGIAGRIGVAVSASVNLADSMDGTLKKGEWVVTPVAFIGATTNTFMGR